MIPFTTVIIASLLSLVGANPILPPNNTSLVQSLFPLSTGLQSWTTCVNATPHLPLSDETLHLQKEIKTVEHPFVNAPDGKHAMKVHYPKGSFRFGFEPQGGVSFYARGPVDVDVSKAKEVTFGYSVFFEEGFDFGKGGKVPDGGDNSTEAFGCSGGRRSDTCFSARLMWRANGAGEFYVYFPTDYPANQVLCTVPPYSKCDPIKGTSVGRGAFTFVAGGWTTVSERVKLNDVGVANGEIELFVAGKSVVLVKALVLRARSAGKFRGIQMQTFFGGADESWASSKDQDAYFADFSVAILERL